MLVATTENASAFGIDPETGKLLWSHHFGTPFPASAIDCGDISPNAGSTSTPVIDTTTGTVYLTTKVVLGNNPKQPTWFMHALSVQTGAERAGWPVKIAGFPDNDSKNAFSPYTEQQRPGLLLLNGVVYVGFGSSCDVLPFRGYVAGISTTTHSITALWADEAGTGSKGAGIWQSGGGLVSDGPGQIVLSTGNGLVTCARTGQPDAAGARGVRRPAADRRQRQADRRSISSPRRTHRSSTTATATSAPADRWRSRRPTAPLPTRGC